MSKRYYNWLIAVLIALIISFSLVGCGNQTSGAGNQDSDSQSSQHSAPDREYNVYALYFPNFGTQNPNKAWDPLVDCEWGTVNRAITRFDGHIAHKPLWGYENHSDPQVMAKVIDAAVNYGIDGFFFDWYWFREARLGGLGLNGSADGLYLGAELERGFLQAENCKDMEFAIYWCNHECLGWNPIFQDEEEWDIMTDYIIDNYMSRPNYARVNGKLYFGILSLTRFVEIFKNEYGMTDIRLAKKALESFNQKAIDKGLGEITFSVNDSQAQGVDATTAWPGGLPPAGWDVYDFMGLDLAVNISINVPKEGIRYDLNPDGGVLDYDYYVDSNATFIENNIKKSNAAGSYTYIPTLQVGYDPTIRISPYEDWDGAGAYPHGPILWNNTPDNIKKMAYNIRSLLDKYELDTIFIGAWNEWGEGAFMEPCEEWGYGYLRAVKEVFGTK